MIHEHLLEKGKPTWTFPVPWLKESIVIGGDKCPLEQYSGTNTDYTEVLS